MVKDYGSHKELWLFSGSSADKLISVEITLIHFRCKLFDLDVFYLKLEKSKGRSKVHVQQID